MRELKRLENGSVTRRHFLAVTGLATATAALAGNMPWLKPRSAFAAGLSGTVNLTTWPNYHSQQNLDDFAAKTGVKVNMSVFGSNEEMLAKLQAGSTGWDVLVPTNYTISTYKGLDLIEAIELAKLPNYDPSTQDKRFTGQGTIDGTVYAVPKDWGTTGFVINTKKVTQDPKSWKVAGQPIRELVTVNGVRVTVEDGTWGLVRASSNKPELVVVVESPMSEQRMREMFQAIDSVLRTHPEVGAYNQTI